MKVIQCPLSNEKQFKMRKKLLKISMYPYTICVHKFCPIIFDPPDTLPCRFCNE